MLCQRGLDSVSDAITFLYGLFKCSVGGYSGLFLRSSPLERARVTALLAEVQVSVIFGRLPGVGEMRLQSRGGGAVGVGSRVGGGKWCWWGRGG